MSTRNSVLVLVEGQIFQALVVDQHGKRRVVAVYVCGSDVYYANDFFGLFDPNKARKGPRWLREQVLSPSENCKVEDYQGNSRTLVTRGTGRSEAAIEEGKVPRPVPTLVDDDAPSISQG